MKNLKKYILDNLSIEYYDTICEIEKSNQEEKIKQDEKLTKKEQEMTREQMILCEIEDLLDYVSINQDNLKQYKKEKNDFWNDKNADGNYFCDITSEWADSRVSIYNYNLWREAPIFSDYIEDALNEYGFDKERGLIGLFMQGQFHFYNGLAGEVLQLINNYVNEAEWDKIGKKK
jgi:hypothetical protein